MGTEQSLAGVSIVLVETSHPGNIGAVARAMKNMGLVSLRLVRPRRFPDAEATARASGADDLLAAAQVYESLQEAIADAALVYGASGRQRSLAWPQCGAREAARAIVSSGQRTCVLFGTERSGLSNAELDRCQQLLYIPTSAEYSSLNLAMAVQVVSYELRMSMLAGAAPDDRSAQHVMTAAEPLPGGDAAARPAVPRPPADPTPLATAEQMEALYAHYERTLSATGFLDPSNPRHLMRRLRRLYGRALPDQNEMQILRGILSSVDALGARGPRGGQEGDGGVGDG
jgi:TrmH family RNA methyltransferase